jgi:phosphatidylglycerol:prolipoprotein diacylglycerol transferase
MYPYVTLDLFLRNKPVEMHSGTLLLYLTVFLSVLLVLIFARHLNLKEKLLLGLGGSLTGFFGARLFHVFFERWDYFKAHPQEIFTRYDGMTFYGSFLLTGTFLLILHFVVFKGQKKKQSELWDMSALALGLGYGVMRIGCFLSGCCWGKITGLPWNVQFYDPRSVMPYLGIPVHPVQLYDAFVGFSLFALCLSLKLKEKASGKLIIVVLLFYPVGRIITEFFRADSYRGENVFWLFSTSQTISLGLLVLGIILAVRELKKIGL